jgi:3-keto-5-aminohexanoate cleavage enzyme
MSEKIIVTCAVTGSFPTKEMNPAVPYSPKEIIDASYEAYKAGASVVHIHVRDPQTGEPTFNIDLFREVLEGIREKANIIVNLTTSGLRLQGPDAGEERLKTVLLKPDMCSFDIGSMNFGDRVGINSYKWGEIAVDRMKKYNVKPEIEVFDTGHIYQAIDLINRGLIDNPPYFQLCMGGKWGIEGTPENLIFMRSKLPQNAVWGVLGIQKTQLPMIQMGIIMGGHIRVGFEDNLYLKRGVLAKSNAELVEAAVSQAKIFGRSIATPEEAREILGMKNKRNVPS